MAEVHVPEGKQEGRRKPSLSAATYIQLERDCHQRELLAEQAKYCLFSHQPQPTHTHTHAHPHTSSSSHPHTTLTSLCGRYADLWRETERLRGQAGSNQSELCRLRQERDVRSREADNLRRTLENMRKRLRVSEGEARQSKDYARRLEHKVFIIHVFICEFIYLKGKLGHVMSCHVESTSKEKKRKERKLWE